MRDLSGAGEEEASFGGVSEWEAEMALGLGMCYKVEGTIIAAPSFRYLL